MNLEHQWSGAFTKPDRRPIWEWAADNITLPAVLTKTGAFDVSGSRHFMLPFTWLHSESVREVNVMAPPRSGKTLLADVSVPWAVVNDHASVLWVFQTGPLGKSHAELRAMPTLKSSQQIRDILPADRHKDRTEEILFTNGLPFIICGPSISNLQSRGFKWVICDEPWLYDPGVLYEAKTRNGDFVKSASSKFLAISQGGVEDDDWDTQHKSGELNEWHVQCESCGHMMAPEWTAHRPDGTRWGIMFDGEKDAKGRYNIARALETLRFECEKCAFPHTDSAATRARWNLTGEYRVIGDPHKSRKSARWNALIDYPWHALLEEWLSARHAAHIGNFDPTIQFVQKRLARPKSEKTIHEGTLQFARAKITDEKWESEVLRCVTVDRQSEDTYWLTARQWAKDTGESRRITFRRCYSEADIVAAVAEVNPSTIRIAIGGQQIAVRAVLIDSGYRPKGDAGVYAMCARHGWMAGKGTDEPFFWHSVNKKDVHGKVTTDRIQRPYAPWTWGDPGEGTESQGRKHAPLIRFSASPMTDRMQDLIDRGLWLEPEGDSETEMGREYDRQMSSEFRKRKVNKMTGKEEMYWACPSGNNHARDCGKESVLLATITQLL